MSVAATSLYETPLYFAADGNDLFGILTRPTGSDRRTTLMMMAGSRTPATGRDALWVRMARTQAAEGYHALRFDFHGNGESTGDVAGYDLARPFTEDVMSAHRWLLERGLGRVALIGTCFGGRTAMDAAAKLPDVAAVALFSVPLKDGAVPDGMRNRSLWWYARKLTEPETRRKLRDPVRRALAWRLAKTKLASIGRRATGRIGSRSDGRSNLSPGFLGPLATLLDRDVPVLLAYGTEDDGYTDLMEALEGDLGRRIQKAGPQVRIAVFEGRVHGMASKAAQDFVLTETEGLLRSTGSGSAARQ